MQKDYKNQQKNKSSVADTCTITSEMKFFIPSRWSTGNAFHLYLITPSRTCIYKHRNMSKKAM